MEYSHMGIPTQTPREGETYLDEVKLYLTDFEKNPYGIEWLRFMPNSPMHEAVRTIPHVAFKVDDLEAAIEGKEVIVPPTVADEKLRYAFIMSDGAPVELMQYS